MFPVLFLLWTGNSEMRRPRQYVGNFIVITKCRITNVWHCEFHGVIAHRLFFLILIFFLFTRVILFVLIANCNESLPRIHEKSNNKWTITATTASGKYTQFLLSLPQFLFDFFFLEFLNNLTTICMTLNVVDAGSYYAPPSFIIIMNSTTQPLV